MLFAFLISISVFLASANSVDLADIGFSSAKFRLEMQLIEKGDELLHDFKICRMSSTTACISISSCLYTEAEVAAHSDLSSLIFSEVESMFLFSSHSQHEFEVFYNEFIKLLTRAKSSCQVKNLDEILLYFQGENKIG
jgi:hypothetical protein